MKPKTNIFKHLPIARFWPWLLVVAGFLALAWGGYSWWLANIKDPDGTTVKVRDENGNETDVNVQFEGGDVDVTPLPVDALANYKVGASDPRALYIDKIGVRARIMHMGLTSDGSVKAPYNIYDSGWYNRSAKPGTMGAMLIDGHASGSTRVGLFAYLDTLQNGDIIKVGRGDGQVFSYKVVHTAIVRKDKVDMSRLMQPWDGKGEGVNLITCTGQWVESQQTYTHRVLVYAKRV